MSRKVPVHPMASAVLKAPLTPAASVWVFHKLTAVVFLYFTWCCAKSERVVLSLAMSYYTLLMAPAIGISTAAGNRFSNLYSNNGLESFTHFRKQVIRL